MITLKSFMTNVPPINAMPFKKHINKVEMVAKIGKRIPHPVAQKLAHSVDLVVSVANKFDKAQEAIQSKRFDKIPKPK